jgi:excisionase family DNA binding protein
VRERAIDVERLREQHTCSIEEAAALLGIGRSTAFKGAHDGSLPTIRISGRLLVPTAQLMAMLGLKEQCEASDPTEPEV